MNYLIIGNSFNLIDKEISSILQDKKRIIYNLDETPFENILDDIDYDSMFETEKNVIVKNIHIIFSSKKDNEASLERLKNYLEYSKKTTTIIFVSPEKIASKGTIKNLLSYLKVIETPIITKPYELAKIIGELIRQNGYTITQNALNIFCEKCVSNYDIALQEFTRLKNIKKSNSIIDEKDIEQFVCNYNLDDIFGFKDAVINRNLKKSFSMIEDLESSKAELVSLVIMLAKEYQVLYNVKLLSYQNINDDKIGATLNKMHPYRVKLLRQASMKYSFDEIEKIILELCNLNFRLVSEDNTGFNELKRILLIYL